MSNPDPTPNREKENMTEPMEEFLADSPHELPPQALGRTGAPEPKEPKADEPAQDQPTP